MPARKNGSGFGAGTRAKAGKRELARRRRERAGRGGR